MTRAKIGAGRALSRTSADRIKKYVDAMGAYFCKAGDLVLLGIYAADEEGLTIMQIVEALGLLQPTVSMSVSALVEDGMVERERRGAGIHATTVSLTEKGEERARTVKAHAHDALAGVEDGDLVAKDLVLGSVEGILVEAEGHGLLLASVVRGSTPLV